jgi:hypothetical protein
MYTDREKWQAAKRETNLRRRVYPGLVERGRMTKQEADIQIALMDAIADDYAYRMSGE